ncbi:MAG: hypothetical protein RLY93_15950 [Sumerlaeia bacterium]
MTQRSPKIRPRTPLESRRRRSRALSLTELMVAMTVTLVFTGSVVTAFLQISRAADASEAQIRAHTRARAALDIIARDLQRVAFDVNLDNSMPSPQPQVFKVQSQTLGHGDLRDNDGDGQVDEEVVNGLDEDCDWVDTHAEADPGGGSPPLIERAAYTVIPDLGDVAVDEDNRFSRDILTLRLPSVRTNELGEPLTEQITYRLDDSASFGSEWVLLRQNVIINEVTMESEVEIEPVVFDVVSLDILPWNANDDVTSNILTACAAPSQYGPYYVSDFDSGDYFNNPARRPFYAPAGIPPFPFPAAVYVRVTVNAEPIPLEEFSGWRPGDTALDRTPLKTLSLGMVVTLDETVSQTNYRDYGMPRM